MAWFKGEGVGPFILAKASLNETMSHSFDTCWCAPLVTRYFAKRTARHSYAPQPRHGWTQGLLVRALCELAGCELD
eukprot:8842675-Pyramimonas_sp.AAC.2